MIRRGLGTNHIILITSLNELFVNTKYCGRNDSVVKAMLQAIDAWCEETRDLDGRLVVVGGCSADWGCDSHFDRVADIARNRFVDNGIAVVLMGTS